MDAALVLVLEYGIDEASFSLVELPQLHNHLCNGVRVGTEPLLGKGRHPRLTEKVPLCVIGCWIDQP